MPMLQCKLVQGDTGIVINVQLTEKKVLKRRSLDFRACTHKQLWLCCDYWKSKGKVLFLQTPDNIQYNSIPLLQNRRLRVV